MSSFNLIVRESVNAVIFGLMICLAWRFWCVRRRTDPAVKPVTHGAATALCALFTGEAGRSALAWFSLSAQTSKWPLAWVESASPGWMISGAIIMVGGLCCVRMFPSGDQPDSARRGMLLVALVCSGCLALSLLT